MTEELMAVVRIGTRGSALAVTQTRTVVALLARLHPERQFELVTITTRGDRVLDRTLQKIGDKGLFVGEIEEALLEGRIDLAVHSAKDLPGDIARGLILGAFPQRADPRDVLVCREAGGLEELPDGARIGTSSLRRTAQFNHINPSFEIVPVRGNVDTRLRKLEEQELDAIVLAAAGLQRMGWEDRVTEYLDPQACVPAAGQGALAVQCREGDRDVLDLLAAVNDRETQLRVEAERAFLACLEGGCQVPMGGYAEVISDELRFTAMAAGSSGEPYIQIQRRGPLEHPAELGREAALKLIDLGAREIIEAARQSQEVGLDD